MADIKKLQAMLDEALINETQGSFHRWLESVRPHLLENDRWVLYSKISNIQRYLFYGPLSSCDKYHIDKGDEGQFIKWVDLLKIIKSMSHEQQLENLLIQLSEIKRWEVTEKPVENTPYPIIEFNIEEDPNGNLVLWQDIEAILKQTFPDDEFH